MSTTRNNTPDPARWMLGGEPPEPQHVEPAQALDVDDLRNGDTHTGTDPLGRAIGPREDHLAVKRVRSLDGQKIVKPYEVKVDGDGKATARALDTRAAEERAAQVAAATDTTPEAVDDAKPYSPAQVAKAHAEGVVLDESPEV